LSRSRRSRKGRRGIRRRMGKKREEKLENEEREITRGGREGELFFSTFEDCVLSVMSTLIGVVVVKRHQ
jgi:hypothetical protein